MEQSTVEHLKDSDNERNLHWKYVKNHKQIKQLHKIFPHHFKLTIPIFLPYSNLHSIFMPMMTPYI